MTYIQLINDLKNGKVLLEDCSDDICDNEDCVIAALSNNFFQMKSMSDRLKNSKEFIMRIDVLDIDPNFIGKALLDDEDIVKKLINKSGLNIYYVGEKFKNNKEYNLMAVKKSGHALSSLIDKYRDDKEIVLEAIRNKSSSIVFTKEKIRDDEGIFYEAMKDNKKEELLLVHYASERLKNKKDFVLVMLNNDIKNYQFISNELKKDKEIIDLAIEKKYNVLTTMNHNYVIDDSKFLTKIIEKLNDMGILFQKNITENFRVVEYIYLNNDYNKIINSELRKNNYSLNKDGINRWILENCKEAGDILLNEYEKKDMLKNIRPTSSVAKIKKF